MRGVAIVLAVAWDGPEVSIFPPVMATNPPSSPSAGSKDPLHGVTLERLLTALVERHGWEGLADRVDIRCFKFDPSIKSSLQFLRRTPWARAKVEQIYVNDLRQSAS